MAERKNVDRTLARARTLARRGESEEAARLYREVLEAFPGNQRAQDGLKELVDPSANTAEGRALATKLALAMRLEAKGRFDEAVEACARAIMEHPGTARPHFVLGTLMLRSGQPNRALKPFTEAIRLKPDFADAFDNLGNALKALGELNDAAACYQRALKLEADRASTFSNLGTVLKEAGEIRHALACVEKALALDPRHAAAHANRSIILKEVGRYEEALEAADAALAECRNAPALSARGEALRSLRRHPEAVEAFRAASAIEPNRTELHNNLGVTYGDMGEREAAADAYRKALAIEPDNASIHRHLASQTRYKSADAHLATMERLLARPGVTDADAAHLHHGVAKAYEDLGDVPRTFHHIATGNALRARLEPFNEAKTRAEFDLVRELFSGPHVPFLSADEVRADLRPIFVVGMPRSGTTLTEQILASHSLVYGAGELSHLTRAVRPLLEKVRAGGISALGKDDVRAVREHYLGRIRTLDTTSPVIVDKMPMNFRWVGFALAAFPEAKIVHTLRDPAAVCWSNFKQYFTDRGLEYTNRLEDTARYYIMYRELMAFWNARFPDAVHLLHYERLTEDQRTETARLLAHADLSWEDACLEFHRNERAVMTASKDQVRRKLYKGSSEAWRRYQPFLAPLLDRLAEAGYGPRDTAPEAASVAAPLVANGDAAVPAEPPVPAFAASGAPGGGEPAGV